ncbi:MAG: hypothetical protein QM635_04220 [Microbacteriaceae bacterium]
MSASRGDATRPAQLIAFALGLGVFVGLVVFMGTREPLLAVEFGAVAFIAGLVTLAMLALAVRPSGAERADLAEQDLAEQDGPGRDPAGRDRAAGDPGARPEEGPAPGPRGH